MAAACDRCAKAIKRTDDVISCKGFCEHVFHIKCTTLDKDFAKIVSDSPNLHWMCDECTKLMKVARFRSVVAALGTTICDLTHSQEVANIELRNQLDRHSQLITQLSNRINMTTPLPSISTSRRTNKRRRTDDDSQPIKPLLGGTKTTEDVLVVTVPEPSTLFWVYLSRLHTSVMPAMVEKMTKDSLHCDEVKVIPLVKRGTDMNSLNFISYKVDVDPKFRSAALDPSSWPKGVLFREFEDHRSYSYWLPDCEPSTPSITSAPDCGAPCSQPPTCMQTLDC